MMGVLRFTTEMLVENTTLRAEGKIKSTQVLLGDDLARELDRIAFQKGRISRSALIRQILGRYIRQSAAGLEGTCDD
jgi:Ribbon-helix-helix protein, copG family